MQNKLTPQNSGPTMSTITFGHFSQKDRQKDNSGSLTPTPILSDSVASPQLQNKSYVEIYASLLQKAMKVQEDISHIVNKVTLSQHSQGSFDNSFPMIDDTYTKSFKDLCAQLLFQLEHMGQLLLNQGKASLIIIDTDQQQIKEFYGSQAQE